ncbi:Zcf27p [Fusarium torreyae]|uniref:Zcf27p n=1 Tax=Fusarium torreyae TaxID=1237075 RepID=A0A9W8S5T4_9HYPO|nr:Zcf27p [Fusarium torreyae]
MPGSSSLVDDPPQLFPNPPEGCQGDIERAWYFYLSEISLWRLEVNARRSIDQLQQGDCRGLPRTLIEVYHDTLSQLEAWRSSLPPLVSIENGSTTEEDDVIRFVLRGRVTYVHELISWPFLYAIMSDRNENGAADQQVADALAFHYDRLLANTSGYYHRHHGTWLMVRSSARSACILLGFVRLYPSSRVMPPAWKDAVLLTLKMVEYWSTEIKEMCPVLHTMTRLLEIVE